MKAPSSTPLLVGSAALLMTVALYPVAMSAHHKWGKYHWERTQNPLVLTVVDNTTGSWSGHVSAAINDWDDGAGAFDLPDVLTLNSGNGNKGSDCPPTLGRIDVCNGAYGQNGWLGIAQIWIGSGQHIVQAITKVNDTYFAQAQYNSDAWRRFVMCQEIGHDFGLSHQDERFGNPNLGSCMDYTDDPAGGAGQLSNLSPNYHDFEQLALIYEHLDGSGGGGGGGGGGGRRGGLPPGAPGAAIDQMPGNDPSSWGRLVAANGRIARYVLDLGNGGFVLTVVIWA